MDQGQRDVALRATEVPMLEPEIVRQIRGLAAMSWGSKRIAVTLGISPAVSARCEAGSAAEASGATARRRSAHRGRGLARRRGRRQCGRRAPATRRARDRSGAAHSAAGRERSFAPRLATRLTAYEKPCPRMAGSDCRLDSEHSRNYTRRPGGPRWAVRCSGLEGRRRWWCRWGSTGG
jgi:hypothetical protein